MTGVELIAAERERQVGEEGWTPKHDDSHTYGDLAVVAATLAVHGTDASVEDSHGWRGTKDARFGLPWGLWKHREDRTRLLTIAGALIAAEIDRLQRLSTPTDSETEDDE